MSARYTAKKPCEDVQTFSQGFRFFENGLSIFYGYKLFNINGCSMDEAESENVDMNRIHAFTDLQPEIFVGEQTCDAMTFRTVKTAWELRS
jgi:hypothetical protein